MPAPKVALRDSHREIPAGAVVLGAAPADETVEVSVILRRRAPLPPLEPGKTISREEFARLYGAGAADIDRVREFAESEGLRVVSSDAARRTMVLSGTANQMQQAFNVNLVRVSHMGRMFRGRSGPVHIPAPLEGVIEAVHGLDNRPQARPRLRHRSPARAVAHVAGDASYTPVQVAQLYNFPTSVTGAGQTIAIIELGGGYSAGDLSNYFSGLGLNPAPKVTAVGVDGASNQPTGDPSGPDGEVLLDIEVAGAVAPGAAIAVYFAPNSDQGFLDAITTAIHDTANAPSVVSISWGGPESTWTQQSLTSFDQAFQDAATLGVTVCVAAGDGGSTDGQSDGQQHVDFPASSPHALACGGTRLVSSGASIQSEAVWNDGAGQGATGGGVSEIFPLPSFQANAGVPVSVNPSQFAGRGVPDVAGDADPATGYQVLVDGQSIVVGGTSAVAPLWAALIALLNQSFGKPAGYLNPAIYALPASSGAFNDITSGNNGAYSAGPGWDACTGLGSPNGASLLAALKPAPAGS